MSQAFVCERCEHHGAQIECLAISGAGISRIFEVQPYRYCFVTCNHCGFTEVCDLRVLEGEDDVGTQVEILIADEERAFAESCVRRER